MDLSKQRSLWPEDGESMIRPDFGLLRELADVLGGELAGTRVAFEEGWILLPAKSADRRHRSAGTLYCMRHIRGHSASGWNDGFQIHRGHKQRSLHANLQGSRLGNSRGPV